MSDKETTPQGGIFGGQVVVPLTSNTGRIYPGEAIVTVGGQKNKAMVDQIMAADKIRLKSQLGVLSKTDLSGVEKAIKIHLALPL